jgi:hypothetical protein
MPAYPNPPGARCISDMTDIWLQDIESLEEISQNDEARTIFLRMAEMQRCGRMQNFLVELAHDPEVDEDMKGTLTELAQDVSFLHAIEDYVHKTSRVH